MDKQVVIIEVSGGVAEVTECPDSIEVIIIDHDTATEENNLDTARGIIQIVPLCC